MTEMNKKRINSWIVTISIPIVVTIIMNIIDIVFCGVWTISTTADLKSFFRLTVMTLCYSLALNSNFALGRMDMSAGSQMYVGCIIGGNIALSLGLGGIGVLVFSTIIGGIAGLIVGFMFVKLRILPMILGLGMALIYECASFAVNNQQGIMLFGRQGMGILSQTWFIAICLFIVIVVITFLFQNSVFGYRRRAISGDQRLAGDFGINIYTNCLGCYLLGGCLAAFAGVFQVAYNGSLAPVLSIQSKATVFDYMFPMMVGIWLGAVCGNNAFGMFCGALTVAIIKYGLSKFAVDIDVQSLIVAVLWLLFMIYRFNWDKIAYYRKRHERRILAEKYKQEVLCKAQGGHQ